MKIAVLHEPLAQRDLNDWGAPEQMLDGNSHTQGVLLHKGERGASGGTMNGS